MPDIYMKQGDLQPTLQYQLTDSDGPINLTELGVVTFRFWNITGSVAVEGAVTKTNSSQGIVRFAWPTASTDIPGNYSAQFRVLVTASHYISIPSEGYLSLQIEPTAPVPPEEEG